MNDPASEKLRRLFATAPAVGPDESFVARLAADVAVRRRHRRAGMIVLWIAAVLGLSMLLAPIAPSSLLQLPELATGAVQSTAGDLYGIRLPSYLYIVLAACVLPLAATAWLVRRT